MLIACWLIKATDKKSEHVIPIAFTRQKCVCESASALTYSTILLLLLFRKTGVMDVKRSLTCVLVVAQSACTTEDLERT
jgi:hypothetical protein